MVDASFAAPPAITYNSAGSAVTFVPNYESVFTHNQQVDCPLTSCELKDETCVPAVVVAAQTSVVLGTAPYGIIASETIPAGYTIPFCYECIITPTGLAPISFTKEFTAI